MSDVEVIVDEMTINDLPQVYEIERLSFSDPWPLAQFLADLESDCTLSLIARAEHRVVGFALCMLVADEAHLTNIAVHPAFRRKKVGQALMERLFYLGESQGCETMYLDVRRSNEAAISFYQGYGFMKLYERKGYYQNPLEDALVLALKLKGRLQRGVV